jgi:hypothetical protein
VSVVSVYVCTLQRTAAVEEKGVCLMRAVLFINSKTSNFDWLINPLKCEDYLHVCTVHQQYQSTFYYSTLLCVCAVTAHTHNRLVGCHHIDHVINDEDRTITVVLAKHKTDSLKMVPV